VSTPTTVSSRRSQSVEDTVESEGLTLADLLDALGAEPDAGFPAGTAGDGEANEPRGLGVRERVHAWTELAAAWGAGPRGSWWAR
jgi:hypothetical protein